MCGRLNSNGRSISPKERMHFYKQNGIAQGVFGVHNGDVYNARIEKLHSKYWGPIWDLGWRGILEVDGFWDGGKEFINIDKKPLHLGVLYNDIDEFAIITMPALGPVVQYHDRMPLIITDDKLWLGDGKVADFDPRTIKLAA